MKKAKKRLESWYNGEDVDISPELLDCAYKAIVFYIKNCSKFSNGDKCNMQSESPFFLLTEDADGNVSYCWWDDEDNMKEDAVERRGNGERIICAIEISSCRDVEIPPEYTVDDFIEEVNSAYDNAKERGFDNIALVIETDTEQIYYIDDTEDGFQCDEFDYYFEDLDSIAETLYNEKIIGKPVEIRME